MKRDRILKISLLITIFSSYFTLYLPSIFSLGIYAYFSLLNVIIIIVCLFFFNNKKTVFKITLYDLLVVLFALIILVFGRTIEDIDYLLFTGIHLIAYLVILPKKINTTSLINIYTLPIVLFSLFIGVRVIINNYQLLFSFSQFGFDVKDAAVPVFSNINYDASIIIYGLIFSIIAIINKKRKVFMIILPVLISGLLITFSRTSYIVFFMMIGIYTLLYIFFYKREYLFLVLTPLITIVFLIIINVIDIEPLISLFYGQGDNLLTGRDYIWKTTLMLISKKPFLGYGLNYWGNNIIFSSPHNTYLNYAFQFGLFTALLVIIMFYNPVYKGLKYIGKNKSSHTKQSTNIFIISAWISLTIGLFFETRTIGNLRIVDFLPMIVLSLVISSNRSISNADWSKENAKYNHTTLE